MKKGFSNRVMSSVLLLSFALSFTVSCTSFNTRYSETPTIDISETLKPVVNKFNKIYESVDQKDAFLFFSDPHLLNKNNNFYDSDIQLINDLFIQPRYLYNTLPLSFCICGGDWINEGDYRGVAEMKLGMVNSLMSTYFTNYYKVLGNHDRNPLGQFCDEDNTAAEIPQSFFDEDYFSNYGNSYYKFTSNNTLYYALDSKVDYYLDSFRMDELKWLARELSTDVFDHRVVFMHIYFNGRVANNDPMEFSRHLTSLCRAFNERETIRVFDETYDYSKAIGKIHCIITGHNHIDYNLDADSIPVIGIARFVYNNRALFDLCILDYDNGFLNLIRVGEGQDRRIRIVM